MWLSCRGVVVASNTNRARTQMAEGFLRALTCSELHVVSGGVRRSTSVLPAAVSVMREVGVDISQQSPSTLGSLQEQLSTFDAFISIDAPTSSKVGREHSHHPPSCEDADRAALAGESASLAGPSSLLFPSPPAHWTTGIDAADTQERWQLWSPRNPMIAHENSVRKFQDHLYEGEPLFQTLFSDPQQRRHIRLQERWVVPLVSHSYAMERPEAYLSRLRVARDDVFQRCVAFLEGLGKLHIDGGVEALRRHRGYSERIQTIQDKIRCAVQP